MEKLKIYLFGAPRFEYQDAILEISRRKAIGLVAFLALSSQPQSRDTLATLFWPEHATAATASRPAAHFVTNLSFGICLTFRIARRKTTQQCCPGLEE